jgi:hypothetical protein
MKRRVSAIVIVSLMMLASFVITVPAETIPEEEVEEDVEEATLDGFGTIKGYVTRIGILGSPVGVYNAKITATSSFGTYTTKTNWRGYYILGGLELSKKGFAYYNVTANINGYEITEEDVYVGWDIVWLNFSLPPGRVYFSEIEESPVSENSPTEVNENDSSAQSTSSPLSLIMRLFQRLFLFLGA